MPPDPQSPAVLPSVRRAAAKGPSDEKLSRAIILAVMDYISDEMDESKKKMRAFARGGDIELVAQWAGRHQQLDRMITELGRMPLEVVATAMRKELSRLTTPTPTERT